MAATEETSRGQDEDVPSSAPPLYGRMMKAIRVGHSFGNSVRMIKLPLVFTEDNLYADAIAQFFLLTERLEAALLRHKASPMVERIASLGLEVTPGYISDLKEFNGPSWRERAESACTAATRAYCKVLDEANEVETVAAAFILYGALVVGGGKMTQKKVKKIMPSCSHALFDVDRRGEGMQELRSKFRRTFTEIGKDFPESFATLEEQAARFMHLNNTVVLSIRCWGTRATVVALGVTVVGLACVATWMKRR